ncbi:MAG: TrkH family potassium uptake protein [Wujia sp.]
MRESVEKKGLDKKKKKLNICQIIALVFALVIIFGAILLTLPIASRSGKSCGPLTALFTSTSATCVTGLALKDTWTQWSIFGQVVILALIETGGMGFMSVASMYFFALKRKIDFQHVLVMAQSVGTDNIHDVVRIQKKILIGGLSIEAIGACILAVRLSEYYSIPKAIWLGVFHSVSAFCNAGFDIMGFEEPGSSMGLFCTDYAVCITLALLIIIGGIGFVVWDEITRIKSPRKWSIYTKIAIFSTFFLIISGTIVYYILENNNPETFGDMNTPEKLLASFFQSVTTRTAGFAAVDQGALTETGKIITILLMFIGGASGSTAGGLKVVTLTIILMFLFSRMIGKENVEIMNRRIPEHQIMDALSLFGIMTILSFLGSILICGTTKFGFLDGMFESVSALATVGLSTGVTGELGLVGKLLLIVYMFFGRIGILTISVAFLQKKKKYQEYEYPEATMLVG